MSGIFVRIASKGRLVLFLFPHRTYVFWYLLELPHFFGDKGCCCNIARIHCKQILGWRANSVCRQVGQMTKDWYSFYFPRKQYFLAKWKRISLFCHLTDNVFSCQENTLSEEKYINMLSTKICSTVQSSLASQLQNTLWKISRWYLKYFFLFFLWNHQFFICCCPESNKHM